jgi:predicted HTH domain antitoxin
LRLVAGAASKLEWFLNDLFGDHGVKTFKSTEFPARVNDLLQDAAAGKLSLVTQNGEPSFVAVPFTEDLVREGVLVSLAVKLFSEEVVSLREGARIAHLSLTEFIGACSARGVPVVRYSPAELEMELANIPRVADSGQ